MIPGRMPFCSRIMAKEIHMNADALLTYLEAAGVRPKVTSEGIEFRGWGADLTRLSLPKSQDGLVLKFFQKSTAENRLPLREQVRILRLMAKATRPESITADLDGSVFTVEVSLNAGDREMQALIEQARELAHEYLVGVFLAHLQSPASSVALAP
jgi:hypothetical protein